MKKVLATLLALTMLLTIVPLGAVSVSAATSGTTGDCTWTLEDGHLTISGNGAMADYEWSGDAPWGDWGNDILSVTIADGVTSIGAYAFGDCTRLTSVTIPDSVTDIGSGAFYSCVNLTDVYYGGTLSDANAITIEDGNDELTNATWHYNGASCDTLGHAYDSACDPNCNECGATRTVSGHTYDNASDKTCNTCGAIRNINAQITSQPAGAQVKNGETAKVTVGATGAGLTYTWYIKNKGASKYSKSSIKTNTYSVKMSSTSRDRSVYCVVKDKYGNSVKSNTVVLRMAASITKESATAAYAKQNASAKATVTAAGDGLTYAWYVKNPDATEYVKSSVTSATYAAKMTAQNSGRLVYCIVTDKYGKEAKSKTFVLRMQATITSQPKTVTAAKNTTLKVPVGAVGEGLTYTWYIKNAGSKKFTKSSVTASTYSVKMTDAVKNRQVYCVVKDAYGKTATSNTVTLKLETNYVYKVSGETATITGYKGKGGAITIPSALGGYPVTAVGESAFFDCGNLTTITFPATVTSIDTSAFRWSGARKFVVAASNPVYSTVDGVLFNKAQTELLLIPEDKTGSYTVPNGVVSIEPGAGCYSMLSSITIPDSVKTIGGNAFGMSSLKKVIIGNGVTTIGDQAFCYCGNLTSMILGNSVATIGYAAFYECGFTTLALPKSVTTIEADALSLWYLTKVYYEGNQDDFEGIDIHYELLEYLNATWYFNCRFVTVTSQPASVQVKNGETAKVAVGAAGDGLTYTWYFKNKGASKYSKSSIKTDTYTVKMSSTSRDRYLYCVVKDKYGNEVQTRNVALRMAASITKEPTTAYAKRNANATVKFSVAGDGLTYEWWVKNPDATEYVQSSVTKSSYAAKMTEATNGRLVYCVVTDKYGNTAQTKTVVMRMQATITTQPKSVTVKNGTTAKVTIKAAGDGLTYTWYFKNKGAKSFSKSSVKTATYTAKMSTKVNGRQVYCVVKDTYGKTVKSSTVTLKKK